MRLGPEGEDVAVPAGRLVRVPPGVVHGFRNASAAELRYLNFHAPGVGFADYMRALREHRRLAYDQYDPPADGGRPVTEVVIGEPVAEVDAIRVAEAQVEDVPAPAAGVRSLYVLEGELEVGDDAAPAGAWVQLPAGADVPVHGTARVLDIETPVSSTLGA
jgi:quercetin dioxygenase-like cupin family protein